jgi:undecaprenyl-diphosphatase
MPGAISMWQYLVEWDKSVFIKLNSGWTNSFFDAVLPYLRNSVFWAPLYIFILVFITVNYGKKGWWWSLGFLLTVAITDMVGTNIFKEGFERLRPCQDPDMAGHVRLLLKQCSGSFSFVSNHAANHFALATYAFLTFRGVFKKWMYVAYLWAFFIAYAQIYVGVHYPLDCIGGALLGTFIGAMVAWGFHKKWGTFDLDYQFA